MLKVTSGIYLIRNTKTGFIYIGSSQNIEKRFNQHKSNLARRKHDNRHLQNSVNKHGIENFTFSIIYKVQCDDSTLREYEKLFMLSENPKEMYNMMCPLAFKCLSVNHKEFIERRVKTWKETVARNGGLPPHSEERKRHQSQATKGEKNGFFGRHHSDDTKKSLSDKAHKRWSNLEERRRQSEARKRYFEENPEARSLVGQSSKGRKQSLEENLKKSIQYSGSGNPNSKPLIFDGVYYGCFKEACLALGISKYKLKKLLKPNDYLERE